MDFRTQARSILDFLKATGVSYKEFAEAAGISVDIIYKTQHASDLSDERARYFIYVARKYFPKQYDTFCHMESEF